ncbi:conserved phage C-terminal domain-containing protein [Bacillus sp. FJAT-27245]|uniref:conserved phage C-terminal domain-containing protein n=1 Tax=Bacillus sp. FJAT-27245 TaxID=1684144 RepID=UPI0006A7E20F|nr:conserved phage C-terminal domain-containing protein [Bacillus sp. FJAT-27245]
MSKLLFDDEPLLIHPTLAVKIGLNESIVLVQLNYWLEKKLNMIDGRSWVYNTYSDWQKQFPFWSEGTIKRVFKSLEDFGYVISGNFNRTKMDQTKWYTIDYEKLKELDEDEHGEVSRATKPLKKKMDEDIPFDEVIKYLNLKTSSAYKPENKKTKMLILARWNEGYRLPDFKSVIDKKAAEWLDHPKWSNFLRPETLFGSKFESYLNQKAGPRRNWDDFVFDDEV